MGKILVEIQDDIVLMKYQKLCDSLKTPVNVPIEMFMREFIEKMESIEAYLKKEETK